MTAELLPLFPLNTVLFPGVVLPLHVFEHRYRTLFDELCSAGGSRRFGVVAIKLGLEVGEEEEPVLHDVGCVAEIRRATRYPDGRYDAVVAGGPRFRVLGVDDSRPFLRATVDYLPEPDAEGVAPLVTATAAAFGDYCRAVAAARDEEPAVPRLPVEDPALLSYVAAAALRLDLPEKQALLAIPDTPARLRRLLAVLRREIALLGAAPRAVPTEGPFSLN